MSLYIPDSADAAYEQDQRRFEVEQPSPRFERPCESCGEAEALPGDPDCLACNIEGELEWIQRELQEAA